MIRFFRALVGIIVGLVLAFMLVIGVELFSALVHPFPEGFAGTQDEVCAHVEKYPAWVLAIVVPMWSSIVICSVWVSEKIGGPNTGLLMGAILFVAVAFNQGMLPYPIWFEVANLAAFPLVTLGAFWHARGKVVATPDKDKEERGDMSEENHSP